MRVETYQNGVLIHTDPGPPEPLESARARRSAEVQARTGELRAAGFPHRGLRFGLGEGSRGSWSLLAHGLTLGFLPYPVPVGSVSGGSIDLADGPEVGAFLQAFAGAVFLIDGAETALLAAIAAAPDAAALAAVADGRAPA